MIKKISLVCVIVCAITGCKSIDNMMRMWYMGSSYQHTVDRQISSMQYYCEVNGFNNCLNYYQCIFDQYKDMRTDDRIMRVMINDLSFPKGSLKKSDYVELVEKTYKRLDMYYEDFNKQKAIYGISNPMKSLVSYPMGMVASTGYLIKTHNHCASIIGDKTYNIDKYMPLIKEKLKIED